MHILDLSPDLLDRILTSLPDFATLNAAICTSKVIYNVFNARPKSISQAVAVNILGYPSVLPTALSLARTQIYRLYDTTGRRKSKSGDSSSQSSSSSDDGCENCSSDSGSRDKDILEDDSGHKAEVDRYNAIIGRLGNTPDQLHLEDEVLCIPVRFCESKVLEINLCVVEELELLFSLRYKDRFSRTSQLTEDEARHFHRAIYRHWKHCELYHELYHRMGITEKDVQGILYYHLRSYSLEDLAEMARITDFLAMLIAWSWHATKNTSYPLDNDYARARLYIDSDPSNILHGFWEWNGMNMQTHRPAEVFFWGTYEEVLNELNIDRNAWGEQMSRAIVKDSVDKHEKCARCETAHELGLWGSDSWMLLRGFFTRSTVYKWLPGLLGSNRYEPRCIMEHLAHECLDGPRYETLRDKHPTLDDLIDVQPLGTTGYRWNKDERYCLPCIRFLFRERFWLWWKDQKAQLGPLREDCWYGYNCRTQTHNFHHADKLNHVCVPTRGDVPPGAN